MQKVLNYVNKSKRQLFLNVAIADKTEIFLQVKILQQNILTWLSPPDPWKNHHISCKLRHKETGAWFIQGDIFSEWKWSGPPSSLLWIHGKRPLSLALKLL